MNGLIEEFDGSVDLLESTHLKISHFPSYNLTYMHEELMSW
jgi:hypothetical protein